MPAAEEGKMGRGGVEGRGGEWKGSRGGGWVGRGEGQVESEKGNVHWLLIHLRCEKFIV